MVLRIICLILVVTVRGGSLVVLLCCRVVIRLLVVVFVLLILFFPGLCRLGLRSLTVRRWMVLSSCDGFCDGVFVSCSYVTGCDFD